MTLIIHPINQKIEGVILASRVPVRGVSADLVFDRQENMCLDFALNTMQAVRCSPSFESLSRTQGKARKSRELSRSNYTFY